MKRTILTTATLGLILGFGDSDALAQTEKGRALIGGTIGFNSNKIEDDDDATTTLDISPNIGYFVADHFAVGVSLSISSISYGDASVTSLGFGPFLRYHFIEQLFGQIGYSYQSIDYDGFKVSGGELSIALGCDFFLNDHVAIEPQIYYGFGSLKPEGGESQGVSDVGFLLGVQAFIGGGE